MLSKRNLFFFGPDGAGSGDAGDANDQDNRDGGGQENANNQQDTENLTTGANQETTSPTTWEEYLGTLDEPVQNLYDEHIRGLKNTVSATREERDSFKQRMTDLLESLDGKEPQEVKQEVESLRNEYTVAQQKIDFLEEAPQHRCRNASVAFIAAKSQNLFKEDGSPDWEALKSFAPELFGPGIPSAGQGKGTQNPPAAKVTANEWMRKSLGY